MTRNIVKTIKTRAERKSGRAAAPTPATPEEMASTWQWSLHPVDQPVHAAASQPLPAGQPASFWEAWM